MLATIMIGLCYIAYLKQMAFYFCEISDLDSILPPIHSLGLRGLSKFQIIGKRTIKPFEKCILQFTFL